MNYNLLKGKRGIIFGALNEQSIAWKVAEKAVENGAIITLSNTPVAVRMGETNALAEKLNCEVIPADANGYRSVGQCDDCTVFNCLFCYFPCNGLFIQRTENDASLSFQQIIIHTYSF